MRYLAINGRPNIKDHCIFCGEYAYLTGEHMFAQWIGKALGQSLRGGTNFMLVTADGNEIEAIDLAERGGHANARLNLLCEECNSGWGSILQNTASMVLKPLLKEGRWRVSSEECSCIASWVTSFAMVRQFLHPRLVVMGAVERKLFFETKAPMKNISVWVAEFEGSNQLATWYSGLVYPITLREPNVFLMVFTMGSFVFVSYGMNSSVNPDELTEDLRCLSARLIELGLVPVWPTKPQPPLSAPLRLTDEDYRELAPLLKRALEFPTEALLASRIIVREENSRLDVNRALLSLKHSAEYMQRHC